MTTLEIILIIISYILFGILSYSPLKKLNKRGWIDFPTFACFLAPPIWIILSVVAIVEGFKYMFKNNV